jgi:hypothetical protein
MRTVFAKNRVFSKNPIFRCVSMMLAEKPGFIQKPDFKK